jgi:hypothetical protein
LAAARRDIDYLSADDYATAAKYLWLTFRALAALMHF